MVDVDTAASNHCDCWSLLWKAVWFDRTAKPPPTPQTKRRKNRTWKPNRTEETVAAGAACGGERGTFKRKSWSQDYSGRSVRHSLSFYAQAESVWGAGTSCKPKLQHRSKDLLKQVRPVGHCGCSHRILMITWMIDKGQTAVSGGRCVFNTTPAGEEGGGRDWFPQRATKKYHRWKFEHLKKKKIDKRKWRILCIFSTYEHAL